MHESVLLTSNSSALENGVNYFDTAEIYGNGLAEIAMGKAFKRLNVPRKDIVVSTKIFSCGSGVNDTMLSRKHIIEGTLAGLKRLELDYVDVIFAHRPDPVTPIEETCRAFNWLIENGKAFYWGTSAWTPEQAMEAHLCCEKLGLIKPIVEQAEYNLIMRKEFEVDLLPIFDKLGYGTTIWSPLASGILSGKYNDGKIPADSRFAGDKLSQPVKDRIFGGYKNQLGEEFTSKLQGLGALAKELGYTQAQLAIAWCIVNKDVSTCLLGASRVEQMVENLKSLDLVNKWTKETEAKVEAIMKNQPTPAFNWRDWKQFEPRRNTSVEYKA